MKRFHSYGPVNLHHHYSVPRRDLVERCKYQLVGLPDDGGHYFTIWAPRQRWGGDKCPLSYVPEWVLEGEGQKSRKT